MQQRTPFAALKCRAYSRPPRFETFFLNLSTPLKDVKGSAKVQSASYASISPTPAYAGHIHANGRVAGMSNKNASVAQIMGEL